MGHPYSGRPGTDAEPSQRAADPIRPTCPHCDSEATLDSSRTGPVTLFWIACPACLLRGPAVALAGHDPTTARRLAERAWADLPRA